MNPLEQLTLEQTPQTTIEKPTNGMPVAPPPDYKQLRTQHVGDLLSKAYQKASLLKLKREEWVLLTEEFPDEAIEVRTEYKRELIYISHADLRERFLKVFHPGEMALIRTGEPMLRPDTNEVVVTLVMLIRGHFVAEATGRARYFPNNAAGSYADSVESAKSDAFRKCAKEFGVGLQAWRKSFQRAFMDRHAATRQGNREQNAGANVQGGTRTSSSGRTYSVKPMPEPTFKEVREAATKEPDEQDDIPF